MWSLLASQGSTGGEDGFTDKNQSKQQGSECTWFAGGSLFLAPALWQDPHNHPRLFKPSVIDQPLTECLLIDIGF